MRIAEKVEQVVESGVTPISLRYDTVRFFDDASPVYRSSLLLNSLDLGTLTYRQYRFVARRSKQAELLVERHITKLLREIQNMPAEKCMNGCFIIPVYARLLHGGVLAKILFEAFTKFPRVKPSQICIELSADILYEDLEMAKAALEELSVLGVKIAIGEVGDEFCPVFRLCTLPFEYAFLDTYATDRLTDENAEHTVGGLVNYLHALRVRVIAPLLDTQVQIERARTLGCDGYTASREEVTQGGE